MIELSFWKISPGGNTTILITSPSLPVSARPGIAARLMSSLHLHAEQVGFVDLGATIPRIDMMGGEFCGNACRSLAAMLAFSGHALSDTSKDVHSTAAPHDGQQALRGASAPAGISSDTKGKHGAAATPQEANDKGSPTSAGAENQDEDAPLELEETTCGWLASSGVGQSVRFRVQRRGNALSAAIRMPLDDMKAKGIPGAERLERDVHLMRLPGISHLLINATSSPYPTENAKAAARALLARHRLLNEPAAGCIWYCNNGEEVSIMPVVHVRDTGSIHEETACGSGTIALAMHLASSTMERAHTLVAHEDDCTTTCTTTAHEQTPQSTTRSATCINDYPTAEDHILRTAEQQAHPSSRFSIDVLQLSGIVIKASCSINTSGMLEAWIGGPVEIIAWGKTLVPGNI